VLAGGDVGVAVVAAAEAQDDLAADAVGADEAEGPRVAAGALVAVVGDDEVTVGLDLERAGVARQAHAGPVRRAGAGGEHLVAALADRLAGGAAGARGRGLGVLRAADGEAKGGADLLGERAAVDGEAERAVLAEGDAIAGDGEDAADAEAGRGGGFRVGDAAAALDGLPLVA